MCSLLADGGSSSNESYSPNTSLIALRSARPPSITNRIAWSLRIQPSGRRDRPAASRPGLRSPSAAFPEPKRDLDAVGRDPERDHVRAIGDLQPVRASITARRTSSSSAAHQLTERCAGPLDRTAPRPSTPPVEQGFLLLDLLADRLTGPPCTCESRRRQSIRSIRPPSSADQRSAKYLHPLLNRAASSSHPPCAFWAG